MKVGDIPLWLKLGYAISVPIIAVVYCFTYGPANFLWLSDIALLFTLAAGRLIGLAAYMFDRKLPLYLRALSTFHLALPPTLLFLLYRRGYDGRALLYQTLLTWIVLVATYLLTAREQNINWVFGPGSKPQRRLPAPLYLMLEMIAVAFIVFIPMHLVLKYFFAPA